MTIEPIWDDSDKSIIRFVFTPPVASWDEYDSAVDKANEMARSVQHRVDYLFDGGDAAMPQGSPFPHIQRAKATSPDNVATHATVVTNMFVQLIVASAAKYLLNTDN